MKKALLIVALSVVFFSASFTLRYLAVGQTAYANGWDAYFYINEVKSFFEKGKMDVPDASIIYPLLFFIQRITHDYVVTYKVTVCLLAALFTIAVSHLTLRWSSSFPATIALACFTLFSPQLTYFAIQYPKNLSGVILFLFLLSVIDSPTKVRPTILFALNFFGHRVTAVLSIIYIVLYAGLKKLQWRRTNVVIGAVTMLVIGFIIPGLITILDIERFQEIFTSHIQFSPYTFVTSFGATFLSPLWLTEIVIASLLFIMAFSYVIISIYKRREDKRLVVFVIILALLIFPFFNMSREGIPFRLALIFILIAPLVSIFFLTKISKRFMTIGIGALFACLSLLSYKSYVPATHDPPYKAYHVVARAIGDGKKTHTFELFIAHKSLAEYIVYETGVDAMSWLPEYDISEEKLWRVASGPQDVHYRHYLDSADRAFIQRITPTYSLIREDRWQKFLKNIKRAGDDELLNELLTWKNPSSARPLYLQRANRNR